MTRPRTNQPFAPSASGQGWRWSQDGARGVAAAARRNGSSGYSKRRASPCARCTLASYRLAPGQGTQLWVFNYTYKLVDEYRAVDRSLLFVGPCGVSKTHLAIAVLRGLVEKGVPCLFYEFGTLLKEIQITFYTISQARN
jgi:DNA replication protein DnaC